MAEFSAVFRRCTSRELFRACRICIDLARSVLGEELCSLGGVASTVASSVRVAGFQFFRRVLCFVRRVMTLKIAFQASSRLFPFA